MLSNLSTTTDAIASYLTDIHASATGKWTKCQWTCFLGQLKLVNLKNLSSVDYKQLEDAAIEGIPAILDEFAATNEASYRKVVKLAWYAEVLEIAEQARTYLQLIESSAKEAEDLGLQIISSFRGGELNQVEIDAHELLHLEGMVSRKGKKVWANLAHTSLDFVRALQSNWVPIMKINTHLYGNSSVNTPSTVTSFYSPRRWNQHENGQIIAPDWFQKEEDWFFCNKSTPEVPPALERI